MADGWLPSFVTPADAAQGRSVIEEVCAEHGRSIEHDHYGVLVPYSFGPIPDRLAALLAKRRPDLADASELVPTSWEGLTDLIGRFVDVGTSKFVVLPSSSPATPTPGSNTSPRPPRSCCHSRRTDELSHRAGSNVTVGGRAPRNHRRVDGTRRDRVTSNTHDA